MKTGMKMDAGLPPTAPADVRHYAGLAEQAGYDALWTSEVRHDPLLQLGLAATVTDRIRLGTAIAVAFARNPMTLAVSANDVHVVSGGRLLLGLGSQVKPHITRRFSMPWSQPAARMREFICALHAIWDSWNQGTRLRFEGDFYTHTLMSPFFNPGPNEYGSPPVYLAGVGDRMTEVAGEVADGFIVHGFTTERYLREVTLPALRRGRERSGLSMDGFEVSGAPFVATGRTEEELAAARDAVRGQIAFYASTPAYRPVLELHGWTDLGDQLHTLSLQNRWQEMGALIDDDVLDAFAVVGEPESVGAELVRRYGDLMTRAGLYTPYELDPQVAVAIAADVRAAADAS